MKTIILDGNTHKEYILEPTSGGQRTFAYLDEIVSDENSDNI